MSQDERRQRVEAMDALVRAGLEIVRESGIEAVTTRSLAQRTNYSPSTVGYHVQPFHDFVDLLWKHVGSDLAEAVFGMPVSFEQWADQLLAWAAADPHTADFFVGHTPIQPATTRPAYWWFLVGVDASAANDPEVISRLQVMSRRLQAAIELGRRSTADPGRRRALVADELRSIARDWLRDVEDRSTEPRADIA